MHTCEKQKLFFVTVQFYWLGVKIKFSLKDLLTILVILTIYGPRN